MAAKKRHSGRHKKSSAKKKPQEFKTKDHPVLHAMMVAK